MRTLGRVGLVNSRGLAAAQTSRTITQIRGMPIPAPLSVHSTAALLWVDGIAGTLRVVL